MSTTDFVPAWMKFPNTDKTNRNKKFNLNLSNNQTGSSSSSISARYCNKSKALSNSFNEFLGNVPSSKVTERNSSLNHQQRHLRYTSLHNNSDRSMFLDGHSNGIDRTEITATSNDYIIKEREKHVTQNQQLIEIESSQLSTLTNTTEEKNSSSKHSCFFFPVPETPEDTELLLQMGWNSSIDHSYIITDEDKEEYERQKRLSPTMDNRFTLLMSALQRRSLPRINMKNVLNEQINSCLSDDDSSDD